MKKIIFLLATIVAFCVNTQGQTTYPNFLAQRMPYNYYSFQYLGADSAILLPRRVANFTPKRPAFIYDTAAAKLKIFINAWKTFQDVTFTGSYLNLIDTPILVNVTKQGNTFNGNNQLLQLDNSGKVPFTNLPASLQIYKGTWSVVTNTPSLTDGVGTTGWIYQAIDSGTINFGHGNITFNKNDYVGYNGSIWQWSPGTPGVRSINGLQGVVTLTTTNVSEGSNLYYTNARVQTYADTRYSLLSHTHTTTDITNLSSYTGFDTRFLKLDGTNTMTGAINLPSGRNISASATGMVLSSDGSFSNLSPGSVYLVGSDPNISFPEWNGTTVAGISHIGVNGTGSFQITTASKDIETYAGADNSNKRAWRVFTGDDLSLDVDINGILSVMNSQTYTTGGVQFLVRNATSKNIQNIGSTIADSYISSASNWNAKQNALSGTGFVKVSGTTVSYDNNTYAYSTGGNASGTWVINITGNATTVTNGVYTNTTNTLTGTLNINAYSYYSATLQSTKASSNIVAPSSATGSLVFAGGTSQIRIGTDNSFNIDMDNSGSPIRALSINQSGYLHTNSGIWNSTQAIYMTPQSGYWEFNYAGLKTAAPSGSTAYPWKMGGYVGSGITPTGYIIVEINGVLYGLSAAAIIATNPKP